MRSFVNVDGKIAGQSFMLRFNDLDYLIEVTHATVNQNSYRKSGRLSPAALHAHNRYHVIYYTYANTTFGFLDRYVRAEPGMLVLASPGEKHNFTPMEPGATCYSEATFRFLSADGSGRELTVPFGELIAAYTGCEVAPENPVVLDERRRIEIEGLFTRLLDELERHDVIGLAAGGRIVAALLEFVVKGCPAHGSSSAAQADKQNGVELARRHIEAHYRERLTIGELARMACLSPGHFMRSFRKVTGFSPIAYQNNHRIRAAMTILRTTNLPCKDVAARLGYVDIYHFSKTFKKFAGVSPREYRRTLRV